MRPPERCLLQSSQRSQSANSMMTRLLLVTTTLILASSNASPTLENEAELPRQGRTVGLAAGFVPRFHAHQTIETQPLYDSYGQQVTPLIPYDVNAADLIAVEALQQQQQQLQAKVADEEGQFVSANEDFYTFYPQQLTGDGVAYSNPGAAATSDFYLTGTGASSSNDAIDDKTFAQIGQTVNGLGQTVGDSVDGFGQGVNGLLGTTSSGPSASGGSSDNGLVRAVLPAALAGLLAITFSTIFTNQVELDSASNGTVPLLLQFPDLLGGSRKKRDATDNLISDQLLSGGGAVEEYARRVMDGVVLYTLMADDDGCMERVACVFGGETRKRRSGGGGGAQDTLAKMLTAYLPESFSSFRDTFMEAVYGDEHMDCSTMECKKCFAV